MLSIFLQAAILIKLSSLNVHRSHELVRAFISSGGKISQPPKGTGHDNVAQSKIWTRFLEDSETLEILSAINYNPYLVSLQLKLSK